MILTRKKELAANALGVGKVRIIFAEERLNEIKEAIARQGIIDLLKNGAIMIRQKKG